MTYSLAQFYFDNYSEPPDYGTESDEWDFASMPPVFEDEHGFRDTKSFRFISCDDYGDRLIAWERGKTWHEIHDAKILLTEYLDWKKL